jgi:hypothetical protein
MKKIVDKLSLMNGVKIIKFIKENGNLFLDKFSWIQFTCSDKSTFDLILNACTESNSICKIEEGWGNADSPKDSYVYTLLIDVNSIEPFETYISKRSKT